MTQLNLQFTIAPRRIATFVACAVLLLPVTARAQAVGWLDNVDRVAAAVNAAPPETTTRRAARGGPGAVATGALIGAGVALGVTALAAARYGENEGGGFCGVCMLQWSAITVPIGAGAGALVGYGIKRARPSIGAVPVFGRGGRGLMISTRF